jgi:peptidoglycan/LPS O-acetylase OafA/YrhL
MSLLSNNSVLMLKRDGYDPFIDYLKGVCIVLVILTHCIPSWLGHYTLFAVWGNPAVPVFLMIQVFHAYKRGVGHATVSYGKLWKRIIKPFLMTEAVILSFSMVDKCLIHQNSVKDFLIDAILWGGIGPGSYYPWIYVQFAILLPAIAFIFRHVKGIWLIILFVVIAESIEIASSVAGMTQRIYRLLALRFVFIFLLGYIITFKGIVLNKLTVALSVLSIIATIIVAQDINLEPFVFSFQYRSHHWFCYIYIAFVYIYFLWYTYRSSSHVAPIISKLTKTIGLYSYEIFLFQMLYFALFHEYVMKGLSSVFDNNYTVSFTAMLIAVVLCIWPVVAYKKKRRNSCGIRQ